MPLILSVLFLTGVAAAPVFGREVKLEDHSVLIAFDSHSGALTRFEEKNTHWTIERRPQLGVAFRLFAPLPNRRWNPVFVGNNGPDDAEVFALPPKQKQIAATVKKISDHEIRIQWKNPVAENGGVVPLTLTADVTLTNGELTFNATLQNNSPLTVETIDYPYFGDFNPPARDTANMAVRLMRRHDNPDDLLSDEIYPRFNNEKGYWGDFWPTKMLDSGQSPFCLVQAPDEGLYVQLGGDKSPYRLQYVFEQHPGVVSSVTQMVPKEDTIGGKIVHLEFRTCHFVFAPPNSTTNLTPIVLRCYQGDWHVGTDIYKQSAQR